VPQVVDAPSSQQFALHVRPDVNWIQREDGVFRDGIVVPVATTMIVLVTVILRADQIGEAYSRHALKAHISIAREIHSRREEFQLPVVEHCVQAATVSEGGMSRGNFRQAFREGPRL